MSEVLIISGKSSGGGGSGVWGAITGTLSSQTDLQTALTARVLKAGDTMTGDLLPPVAATINLGSWAQPWNMLFAQNIQTLGTYTGGVFIITNTIQYSSAGFTMFGNDARLLTNGGVHMAVNVLDTASSATNFAIDKVDYNGNYVAGLMSIDINNNLTIFSTGLTTTSLQIYGNLTINAANIVTDTTTGLKLGTANNQKLGFFGKAPVVQPVQGATLTNSVTSGGSANTLANYTSLTVYATDAAAIRNDIYQLGQTLKTVVDALRLLGILS